jgi:RNA polymerase sigma factor (sigma-70 family)
MDEVTRILRSIEQGDSQATDRLLSVVYDELRRLAAAKLAHEKPGQTLQATALVHEAYLRLFGSKPGTDAGGSGAGADRGAGAVWKSRGHFFAAAAEAMRRILIENARGKKRIKRGGDRDRVDLEHVDLVIQSTPLDLIALDEALTKLETQDKVRADVVKLHFFAGLTFDETAAALGVSEPTVRRYWVYARAWLRREIGEGE